MAGLYSRIFGPSVRFAFKQHLRRAASRRRAARRPFASSPAAGAMAGMRHARMPVVTASVDSLHFLHPVHIGELIILHASVNRVFRTSMEIGVKVTIERLLTGERLHTCSAYP